jgi:hypothetical protein
LFLFFAILIFVNTAGAEVLPWIVITVIRLLVPILVWWFPLAGSLAGMVADNLDVVILDSMGVSNYDLYNPIDKALDIYLYFIEFLVLARWQNQRAKTVGRWLFGYRLIGVVLYEVTHWRWLLVIFPNVFVTYFMVYLILQKFFKFDPMKTVRSSLIFLTILAIPKVIQEYLFHVVQIPLYNTLRPLVFGPIEFLLAIMNSK